MKACTCFLTYLKWDSIHVCRREKYLERILCRRMHCTFIDVHILRVFNKNDAIFMFPKLTMTQWHNDTVTQWRGDTMARWHNGAVTQWHDTVTQWVTQWHGDTMTRWHWHRDTMTVKQWHGDTQWHNDTVTQWHSDIMTQWHCDTMTRWHSDTVTQWHSDTVTARCTTSEVTC